MKALFQRLHALLGDPQKPVARVLLCGAAGGGLGVTAGVMLGEITQHWYVVLVPYFVLGAGAAFAAVFVLLGIKTEDVYRCCGIALLAGFFWHPVLDASKDYLLNQSDRKDEKRADQLSSELEEKLTDIRKSPTNAALVEEAGALAQTLTLETSDLRGSSVKSRAQLTVAQSLDLLAAHAEKGQPAAAAAVVNVAETAVNSGNQKIAEKARAQIMRVPDTNQTLFLRKQDLIRRMPAPTVRSP